MYRFLILILFVSLKLGNIVLGGNLKVNDSLSFTNKGQKMFKNTDEASFFSIDSAESIAGLDFLYTSNRQVPFWLRSNKWGAIPVEGASVNAMISFNKRIEANKKIDWGVGFDMRGYLGENSQLRFIEGWLGLKYSVFQLYAGRKREVTGLVDSTLSIGNFSVAGNSLPIPQIKLSIPNYVDIPLTNGLFSVKGGISYGWFGYKERQLHISPNEFDQINTFYHQKEFYVKMGKPNWKLKLFGGINHQVQWGNERYIYGDAFNLNSFQSFLYVFFGKTYGNKSKGIGSSKLGNQLGSIDQAINYEFDSFTLSAYHQFYYDIGALAHLANLKDGLWGVKFVNTKTTNRKIYWKRFLLEFLYSKDQAGSPKSKPTPSGPENYYNSYIYPEGWTYKDENIGLPLFTSKKYIKENLPRFDRLNFQNNLVAAVHLGGLVRIYDWDIMYLSTFSTNNGTYMTVTSRIGFHGEVINNDPPYFPKVNQFSFYIDAERNVKLFNTKFLFGLKSSFDYGDLLYNSYGMGVSIKKKIY